METILQKKKDSHLKENHMSVKTAEILNGQVDPDHPDRFIMRIEESENGSSVRTFDKPIIAHKFSDLVEAYNLAIGAQIRNK